MGRGWIHVIDSFFFFCFANKGYIYSDISIKIDATKQSTMDSDQDLDLERIGGDLSYHKVP